MYSESKFIDSDDFGLFSAGCSVLKLRLLVPVLTTRDCSIG